MAEDEIVEVDLLVLKKMKVPELRKQVVELGIESKGTKAEILARVETYLKEQEEDLLEEEEEGVQEEEEEGEQVEGEVKPVTAAVVEQPPVKEATPPSTEANNEQTATITPEPATADGAVRRVSLDSSGLAPQERIAKRAARFGGNASDDAKKLARAERFGTSLENGLNGKGARPPPTGEELEKMKKRAERFGANVASSLTTAEDNDKKLKRKERFGLTAADLSVDERKKARLERFGDKI